MKIITTTQYNFDQNYSNQTEEIVEVRLENDQDYYAVYNNLYQLFRYIDRKKFEDVLVKYEQEHPAKDAQVMVKTFYQFVDSLDLNPKSRIDLISNLLGISINSAQVLNQFLDGRFYVKHFDLLKVTPYAYFILSQLEKFNKYVNSLTD